MSGLHACQYEYHIADVICTHVSQGLRFFVQANGSLDPPGCVVHHPGKIFECDIPPPCRHIRGNGVHTEKLLWSAFRQLIDNMAQQSVLEAYRTHDALVVWQEIHLWKWEAASWYICVDVWLTFNGTELEQKRLYIVRQPRCSSSLFIIARPFLCILCISWTYNYSECNMCIAKKTRCSMADHSMLIPQRNVGPILFKTADIHFMSYTI